MIIDAYMAVLRTIIPYTVIPAFDNGPRPTKPYLSISLLISEVFGIQRGRVHSEVLRTNAQHRFVTMRAEIFGDAAWDIASDLDAALFDEQAIDVAGEVYGISWLGGGKIMDVPQLRDAAVGRNAVSYEPRIVLEVPSAYTARHIENVGAIEHVEGEMSTTPGPSAPRDFIVDVVVTPDAI